MKLGNATIAALVFASLLFGGARAALADTQIDDSDAGWTWSGMKEFDDSGLKGGTAHIGGDGTYGVYTFNGTGVDVYVLGGPSIRVDGRHKPMGSIKVLIDGDLKADEPTERDHFVYNLDIFRDNELNPGNHVLQLVPDGGYICVDYIQVQGTGTGGGLPEGASSESGGSGSGGDAGPPPAPSDGGPPAKIPSGHFIALYSEGNGMYVSGANSGQLAACMAGISATERFEILDEGNGYAALRLGTTGQYVALEQGGLVVADRPSLDMSHGSAELFYWEANADGSIAMRAANGKYLVPDSTQGGLLARADRVGQGESFFTKDLPQPQ